MKIKKNIYEKGKKIAENKKNGQEIQSNLQWKFSVGWWDFPKLLEIWKLKMRENGKMKINTTVTAINNNNNSREKKTKDKTER